MRNAANSIDTPSEAKPEAPEQSERAFFTVRTLFSAVLFGVVGAGLGRLIGRLGEKDDHTLGRTVLSWVGGIGGASLAAFTSTRTAQREQREDAAQRVAAVRANQATVMDNAMTAHGTEMAKPGARIDTVQYAGTVAAAEQQRAV